MRGSRGRSGPCSVTRESLLASHIGPCESFVAQTSGRGVYVRQGPFQSVARVDWLLSDHELERAPIW